MELPSDKNQPPALQGGAGRVSGKERRAIDAAIAGEWAGLPGVPEADRGVHVF